LGGIEPRPRAIYFQPRYDDVRAGRLNALQALVFEDQSIGHVLEVVAKLDRIGVPLGYDHQIGLGELVQLVGGEPQL